MTCIKDDGNKCTRCCEVLGLYSYNFCVKMWKHGKIERDYIDQDKLRSKLIPISKRRAKIINKHAVSVFPNNTDWFKCKSLIKGVGCSDYENRPQLCKSYKGGSEYSETCFNDINRYDKVFYRG